MKTKKLHTFPNKGFTLIEILVVITIIAVLASFGFAGINNAIKTARKVSATNSCVQLSLAVDNFFDEYNYLPNVGSSDSDAEIETTSGPFMAIITGKDNTNNPKRQKFFSAKESKAQRDGLLISGNNVQLFDPWGQAYFLILDTDYNLEIDSPVKSGNNGVIEGKRVIAWSAGQDETVEEGKSKTGGKNKDNAYSF